MSKIWVRSEKNQQRFIFWPNNICKLSCVAKTIPNDAPVTWIRDWQALQRDFYILCLLLWMSIHNCLVPRLNLLWHCNDINKQGQIRFWYCHCLPLAQALHQEVFVLLLSCIPPSGLSVHQFYTPVHRKRRIKVRRSSSVFPFSDYAEDLRRWYGFYWERRGGGGGELVVTNRV